jgi:hypothetical protein
MGNTASRKWIRAGDKRSRDAFLPSLPVCVHWYDKFLALFNPPETDPEKFDPGTLPPKALESLEADSFWCLSALLDGIQVNS